jgi:signal transduction histidine kinase
VTDPLARSDRDRMLLEAGMALASERSLGVVLQRIVELAVDVTAARYGALGVLTPDGRLIEEFITVGVTEQERAAIGDPPTGHGILGLLIREPHPLRLTDVASDPRSVGFPPNHPPMRSLLGLPVVAKGQVFGNIYLTEKQGAEAFDQEDQRALEVLAAQAGVAIENARLYEETERAARELRRLEVLDERERIAKELHDGVIQSLFAVGMGLQGMAALTEDEDIAGRLERAVEEIDHAIRDLRSYIFGLRPGILTDRQLDQALRDLGEEFATKTNVVTVVTVDEGVASELAPLASDIVQITREALSNVGRHAAAATCRVALSRDSKGAAELIIDDDGVGFDPEEGHIGMGLQNLRQRVESLGGELTIESGAETGTTIRAVLPI